MICTNKQALCFASASAFDGMKVKTEEEVISSRTLNFAGALETFFTSVEQMVGYYIGHLGSKGCSGANFFGCFTSIPVRKTAFDLDQIELYS
jgi:hypothetical protein